LSNKKSEEIKNLDIKKIEKIKWYIDNLKKQEKSERIEEQSDLTDLLSKI
jgi:hypothetical protein